MVFTFIFTSCRPVEGELQRQVETLEGAKVKIADNSADGEIPETERLYDVLELSTNGFFPPDNSYTSLSRVVAIQKYENLYYHRVYPLTTSKLSE